MQFKLNSSYKLTRVLNIFNISLKTTTVSASWWSLEQGIHLWFSTANTDRFIRKPKKKTCKAKNHIFISLLNGDWFYCSFGIVAGQPANIYKRGKEMILCLLHWQGVLFKNKWLRGEKKKELKLHREMASVRLSFQTCCFCLIKIVNVQSFKDSGNVKGSSLYFITQDIWSIHQNYFCWNLAQRLICSDFNSEIQHGRLIL